MMLRIVVAVALSCASVSHWLGSYACANDQASGKPSPSIAPPNVVIFLADDAGWGDYGHSGNTMSSTPNIDSIATSGVSLNRFFVCPVCSPTRAEFLTGRYHARTGVRGVSTGQERLNLDEKTIADSFKQAGYATGAFGKWHNGTQWPYHPLARGFDEYLGHTSGHWGEYFDPPLDDNGTMVRTKGYIVDVCVNRALDFIERNQARPFFCYVPFTTPHSPWAAPEENWERFKDLPITQHATLKQQEVPDQTRCAYAMLENQDHNVGRVLAKLDELHLAENTIIVYFSDNGPNSWRWNGEMKGRKGTTDEGGVRSVCYIRWPSQLPGGHKVDQIAGAIDLLPTLASLAAVNVASEKELDGIDLSPLLKNAVTPEIAGPWDGRSIFTTWAGRYSVRNQRYRLDDMGELYDMVADPGQTAPITKREQAIATQMKLDLAAWKQSVGLGDESPEARTQARGKPMRNGQSIDPRPIPVGYREFPVTDLPARDGEPIGKVKRSSSAPNCSYFINWRSVDDRLMWLVDVQTTGRYEVAINYTCPLPDVGSVIELEHGAHTLRGTIDTGWDPPLYTNQDTLPRPPAESQMKEFKTIKLGVIELEQGEGPLTLRAVTIPGDSVMDVRRLTLRLLPE